MRLLLSVDDSKFSEAAAQAVIARYQARNLEVRVFHAAEPPTLFTAPEMAEYIPPEESAQETKALVVKTADALRSAGISVTTDIVQGDPKTLIIENAEEWGADLIVLGSHGRRGLKRFLLGSVSETVMRHAHCSVEIVRLPPK
ncbi:MAG: universal stress protein [Candidatus Acidiferrales bacterium]